MSARVSASVSIVNSVEYNLECLLCRWLPEEMFPVPDGPLNLLAATERMDVGAFLPLELVQESI